MPPPDRSPADSLRETLDPHANRTLRRLIAGSIDTQAIYVAAKLGIADHLSLGPRTAADLAARTAADTSSLRRVLRYLTARGLFVERDGDLFALAPDGEPLQSVHPLSLRHSAIRAGEDMWEVTGRLFAAVRSGGTPHDEAFGASYFDRLADTGASGHLAARMRAGIAEVAASLASLGWLAGARTVVDVGGGHGHLIAALLQAHAGLQGILFDRPNVVQEASRVLAEAGVAGRCEIAAGSAFDGVPAGGDVYLLSWVLHDWSDARAVAILESCRSAAPEAAVVVVEILMPERASAESTGQAGLDPFLLDLQMLLLTGGRERTTREYEALLAGAGYLVEEMRPIVSVTRRTGAVRAIPRG